MNNVICSRYSYASEGESFSIGDPKEAWIMEIIGKGAYEKGAVWVARKVPDGYITGHANQARITTFPLNDPENCIYSPDVISFARKIGLYSADAPDSAFSFSDVYDAVTFSGARACEARVWSFFSVIMGQDWSDQYLDYVQGYNLTNRMPLWVQPPAHSLSVTNISSFMRNHFENSWFDMTGTREADAGAMDSNLPYRWRPLSWSSGGRTYVNERAIATPQTGWNFVAQSRPNVPKHLAGVLWFGVDDSSTTVHFPIYGSATRVPKGFAGKGAQDGVTAPMLSFSMDNAFSVFNLVANWAYSRWNVIYPDVYNKIIELETKYANELITLEKESVTLLHSKSEHDAIEYITKYSERTGNELVSTWSQFFGEIFMRYRDGYHITPVASKDSPACGCAVNNVGYSGAWYDRILDDTEDRYLDPTSVVGLKAVTSAALPKHLQPVDKYTLKALN